MKLLKGGNRTFYEMNVRLEQRESGWDTKEWRSGIAHLKKASEEEEREAGTEGNGVRRMVPYREKHLSKPRPFLRKTKIEALLIPTYIIPQKGPYLQRRPKWEQYQTIVPPHDHSLNTPDGT